MLNNTYIYGISLPERMLFSTYQNIFVNITSTYLFNSFKIRLQINRAASEYRYKKGNTTSKFVIDEKKILPLYHLQYNMPKTALSASELYGCKMNKYIINLRVIAAAYHNYYYNVKRESVARILIK